MVVHRFRRILLASGRTVAGLSLLGLAQAACSGPTPTEPPPVEVSELARAAWTFDVLWISAQVRVSSASVVSGARDGGRGAAVPVFFGLSPGHPELSILGPDVVEVVFVPGSLESGPANAASKKRRIAFRVQVRNRLSGLDLGVSPDFPSPPPGVNAPVLIPFETVATVTKGGVGGGSGGVVVVLPSEGDVLPADSIWEGPRHNFFNDRSCGAASNDCFLFRTVREDRTRRGTIGPGGRSEEVRLGYDAELTVQQFRARLILVAGVSNGST